LQPAAARTQEVTLMVNESAVVVFDDERVVANAGVMLPAVLAGRLGIEELVERAVDLGDRSGAAHPGSKVVTMLSAMVLGADCIEDCDLLRSGQTAAVLGNRVAAPSTLGTFCAPSPSGMYASSSACWARR
jgi:hypothetical protein